jgi:CRISPR-associated endonuclease/helicase Cas3
MQQFIAHPAQDGINHQTVEDHLIGVATLSGDFASKIGQKKAGELIGLLHDFGKYSQPFQRYIRSAAGLISSDDQEYTDPKANKGKIDHSTAGSQWLFQQLMAVIAKQHTDQYSERAQLAFAFVQGLSLCIASHHSGLIDCLESQVSKGFFHRIKKADEKTNITECIQNADKKIIDHAMGLIASTLVNDGINFLTQISLDQQNGFATSELSQRFYLGLYTKFMFSCLIDADRINSADFDFPENTAQRAQDKPDWNKACQRVETFVSSLVRRNSIDDIRQAISNNCLQRADDKQGIYSLTVPTGGGKTYSSLRYAVHHAQEHHLDRIIYIIPYTSIIDQNAQAIKEVLEKEGDITPWVLEHHSNLEPESQNWRTKLISENWDAPIVLTTMVQFLETLFSGGTRGVRRLHQLANSVLIFDEIQTLPINCTHLFCNSINFLSTYCQTTAVMCTATQPLLDDLKEPDKGQLQLPNENELTPNVRQLFDDLKRVNIVDKTTSAGWSLDDVTGLAIDEVNEKQSCLVIVNTKDWAQKLYQACVEQGLNEDHIFHLSTSQCPEHRKQLLAQIRTRLTAEQPILCISTALIEAGVDVDFSAVIRFLAGLDSIAQAAGRCNRNGRQSHTAQVTVINPAEERITQLIDIKIGIEATKRIFTEFKGQDFLLPEIMTQYFKYYFYDRSEVMNYPLKAKDAEGISILNLLSLNKCNAQQSPIPTPLKHAFMSAGKAFKAIDAPTQSLIVPFQQGKTVIDALCASVTKFKAEDYYKRVKSSQKYSVNLFPNVWKKLFEQGAIYELCNESGEGEGIFYLDERFYSDEFGVSEEPCSAMTSYMV